MKRAPGSRDVDRSLKQVGRSLKSALRQLNQQASKRLAAGDYAAVEMLVSTGRVMREFEQEFAQLQQRWRDATSHDPTKGRETEKTPLWRYYQPILKALVALGGSATRRELERHLEASVSAWARSGDTELMARGVPRWKVMVRRARKPMKKEGFVEADSGGAWRITARGRRAAEAAASQEAG